MPPEHFPHFRPPIIDSPIRNEYILSAFIHVAESLHTHTPFIDGTWNVAPDLDIYTVENEYIYTLTTQSHRKILLRGQPEFIGFSIQIAAPVVYIPEHIPSFAIRNIVQDFARSQSPPWNTLIRAPKKKICFTHHMALVSGPKFYYNPSDVLPISREACDMARYQEQTVSSWNTWISAFSDTLHMST